MLTAIRLHLPPGNAPPIAPPDVRRTEGVTPLRLPTQPERMMTVPAIPHARPCDAGATGERVNEGGQGQHAPEASTGCAPPKRPG